MKTGKTPARWKIENTEEVADCRVFRVIRQRSTHEESGRQSNWFVVDTSDFVNVVAVTVEHEIVLVRQFRHGSQEFSLELPGGMIDEGESPLDAGMRELLEETGYEGREARLFADCHPNPAIMNNRCHFVLVRGAVKVADVDWDEHEEMTLELCPIADLREACRRGELTHSLTLAALLRFFLEEEPSEIISGEES